MADFPTRSYYFLNTVARAVAVLDLFTGPDAELGVAEVARRLSLHKSVAHRLLATLTDLGLLATGTSNGTYRLGVKSLQLGLSYLRHSPIDRVAQAHMMRLAQELPDFAFHVAILDGVDIVYQKTVAGTRATRWVSPTLGRRYMAYCTALGKVLLAYLSPAELDNYLSRVELRPYTPTTITTADALRRELEQVRINECAYDDAENQADRRCVGAPIRDHTGRVVAALSLTGLSGKVDEYGRDFLARTIKTAAAAISHDLGFSTRRM
jgi:DNA-binding IclR family transcriptional regulator